MKHELTLQQQLDNARELLTAQGFTVTEPEKKSGAWEPTEGELVLVLGGDGVLYSDYYAPYLHLYRQRGHIFPDTPEGRARAEAKNKRALLIAEAEREGVPEKGYGYWYVSADRRMRQDSWLGQAVDLNCFRSGNYSRTREGMEDKIRRYGLDIVVGRK